MENRKYSGYCFDVKKELLKKIAGDPAFALALEKMKKKDLIDLLTSRYDADLLAMRTDTGCDKLKELFSEFQEEISSRVCSVICATGKSLEDMSLDWDAGDPGCTDWNLRHILREAFRAQLRVLPLKA